MYYWTEKFNFHENKYSVILKCTQGHAYMHVPFCTTVYSYKLPVLSDPLYGLLSKETF